VQLVVNELLVGRRVLGLVCQLGAVKMMLYDMVCWEGISQMYCGQNQRGNGVLCELIQ